MQKKPLSLKDSILATVIYADIFDYPLARDELKFWLLFYESQRLPPLASLVEHKKYMTLRNRKRIVTARIQKHPWQEKKRRIARRACSLLYFLPTIKLIGITGGLSMNNAAREDDIDLFFIVEPQTIWISRLLTTLVMELFGLRRHPGDDKVSDKVCMNMFMTRDAMKIVKNEQDCFSAHEVLQMQPIFVRADTYRQFLKANAWVKFFLPKAWGEANRESRIMNYGKNKKTIIHYSLFIILRLLEPFAKFIQLWYMRNHRTHEVITSGVLRFHPRDARVWVKEQLRVRLARHNIPIDKIFYAG